MTSLEPSLNLGTIADLIIGKSKPPYRYCAQIINGSIDADKIDYISRDTFYSGINTTIDVDRLFNDLSLELIDGDSVLVITSTTPLERLLFSKVLLYSSIYHHQKVKAADCMVAGIVEYLTENSVHLCGLDVSDPINFLRITDEAFLAAANFSTEDPFVRTRIRALLYRDLPHRCLVLSRATVNNYEGTVYGLNRIAQFSSEMRALRQAIVETMPADQRCSVHDVWVSLPPQPSLREASQTLVATSGSELISLDHLFPLDGWLGAFSDNKWRGYVFGPYHLRDAVSKAARSVLKDKLGIELNAKALTYAHLVDPGDNEVL